MDRTARPLARLASPPALFPLAGDPKTSLDLIPITDDPTGRGARAWAIMSRLRITEGIHAGRTFGDTAPPWQPRLTKLLFGHVDGQGRRVLREVFVNMARKNGKTAYAAALALTKLLLNEEEREQVILLANTREQSRLAFDSMAAMIRTDRGLSGRFEVIDYRHTIKYAATGSICRAIAAEMAALVGFNPSMAVVDELHQLGETPKGQKLVSQIRTGTVARLEPLMISISTAPTDISAGVFEATLQKARRVINGEETDPTFFGWLCEPPPGLDPEDPAHWHWSNPSLGYTLDLDRLKSDFASVQSDPAALRDFRSQNLNIRPDTSAGVDRWISDAEWAAAADDSLRLEPIIEESTALWVAVDAGSLDDLTAAVVLGKTYDGRWLVWSHQWISRRGYEKRRAINPYDDWISSGDLTLFEGGGGDIADLAELVRFVAASGKLQLIGIDSYGASELSSAFADSGIEVAAVPQGWRLTPTLSWVERRLAEGTITHTNSPVMNWNIHNAIITRSGNSVSLSKEVHTSAKKIDGVAALLNAVAACLSMPEKPQPNIHIIG